MKKEILEEKIKKLELEIENLKDFLKAAEEIFEGYRDFQVRILGMEMLLTHLMNEKSDTPIVNDYELN